MPELPEVETIVRQLSLALPGREIRRVVVSRPDLLNEAPARFRGALRGRRIVGVGRRGKNILLSLDGSGLLLVHLGMTGQLHLLTPAAPGRVPPHRGVSFQLEPRATLHYADARRFGRLRRLDARGWASLEAGLGPEPLDPGWTPHAFRESLSRSRSPIRSWLLDQKRVAGVGNIYANEALFRARIHPARSSESLSPGEAGRLLTSLRLVLEEAIEARGTTLRDYRTAGGEIGDFGPRLRVYGREGEPCTACGSPVSRIVFGNRAAFLCPRCQVQKP